jgi:hypothetical protein
LSDAVRAPSTLAAPRLVDLGLDPSRPLVIVDVDEVLGHFVESFVRFLHGEGYEFRLQKWALFENIYRPGADASVGLDEGRGLFERYFVTPHCAEIQPAAGSQEALARLSLRTEIVILSNAPAAAEALRLRWLRKLGLPHPLILNMGLKGPITAGLAGQSAGRSAIVDDQLVNLDSVAEHSPETATFQHVADERLRPLAPTSERHTRIDDWQELAEAIEAAVLSGSPRP